jgi:hypothetical protein
MDLSKLKRLHEWECGRLIISGAFSGHSGSIHLSLVFHLSKIIVLDDFITRTYPDDAKRFLQHFPLVVSQGSSLF